jgi:arylsulfatase A-like enzyme
MTRFPLAALALAAALVACGAPAPQEPAPSPRLQGAAKGWNVVLLTLDTVRADRFNSYGYGERTTTPKMDALFSQGVRFEQAMAPRALTWPSLSTVLSGLYPSGHGVIQNGYELPDALPTLPRLLADAGYETAAFLSNMCKANHQGWQTQSCSQGRDGAGIASALAWAQERAQERAQKQTQGQTQGQAQEAPFFLWVHLFGAHGPYYNGGDLAAKLDPGYTGNLVPKKWRLDAVMQNKERLAEADIRHLNAIYDAAVIGTDRLVQRLLEGLRQAGSLERTVIVVLSDHGEDLYQHNGYIYHACSPYQSGLHVPLAIVAPGLIPAGGSVRQTVELADVAPTLLDLLGLEVPDGLHGSSLRPYLERPDRGGAGKPAFSEYGDTRIHTVLADNWKLIDNPDGLTPFCFAGPKDLYPLQQAELYDLAQDPHETTNLAAAEGARVELLRALIRQRFAGLAGRAAQQEIPEDLKKELRSLGYVAP